MSFNSELQILWNTFCVSIPNFFLIVFTLPGGIADTVAKWVFKQGFNPLVLNLAQHRNNTESTEEAAELHTNIFLEEPEADEGLETILGKKITRLFEILNAFRAVLDAAFVNSRNYSGKRSVL